MGKVNGDKMLVNEIKAGNQIAFEAMVIKYQPKHLSSLISYIIFIFSDGLNDELYSFSLW